MDHDELHDTIEAAMDTYFDERQRRLIDNCRTYAEHDPADRSAVRRDVPLLRGARPLAHIRRPGGVDVLQSRSNIGEGHGSCAGRQQPWFDETETPSYNLF
jgi:hypothetical protein